MGFGGSSSPSVPEVQPAPKAATPKPVTEAATAARQNQKDKASKRFMRLSTKATRI